MPVDQKTPVKPALVKRANMPILPMPPRLTTRRTFLEWSVVAWLFFFTWLSGVATLFMRFVIPNVLYEKDPRFIAGKKYDYPESPHVYEMYKQSQRVWIVRLIESGEDHLVALSTICTHLGCTPNWLGSENKFKCPCHGSGYYENGINFEGPAPRPLERFRIYIDSSNNVVVDKSKSFRKELGQWASSDSYIIMT